MRLDESFHAWSRICRSPPFLTENDFLCSFLMTNPAARAKIYLVRYTIYVGHAEIWIHFYFNEKLKLYEQTIPL